MCDGRQSTLVVHFHIFEACSDALDGLKGLKTPLKPLHAHTGVFNYSG